ncbi:MAG: NAD(P)/FAD-dependent oxidoreductase [Candidatus Hydrogenedentes bacterium]|nr:NAD(P)/FAD-dependent oxidoreductase [Candidatus Hydrogenedentota bacterium]
MAHEQRVNGTLIVGAGPAGLALGACLRRRDQPFTILEAGDAPGASWRNHYERLHLHTVKQHSALPHLPFPEHVGQYPSRQDVVEYLDAYSRHFELNPRCGEEVQSIRRDGDSWHTTTSGGSYISGQVVIAAGYNRHPYIPPFAGIEDFGGDVVHSREYRNGVNYRDKRVLVVGFGNTGGEIAIDLHEHGAASIAVCVRTPVHVIPREFLGTPTQISGIMLSKLPTFLSDFISSTVARIAVGDLSQYGIHRPKISPAAQINRYGRVPLIDIGTIDLVKRGIVRIVPGINAFTGAGASFVDGTTLEFDSVILATGYRPALDEFLEDAAAVTDPHGFPIPRAGASALAGLYFLGYTNPSTGLLRQIAIDAQRVANEIAAVPVAR